MGLFSRGEKSSKPERQRRAQGSTWTHGRQMSGKVLSAVLFAALACGPIALVASAARPAPVVASAPETSKGELSPQVQAAGGYAVGFVGAWLSATKDSPGELGAYIDLAGMRQLSSTAWEYRDLTTVSVTPVDGTEFINVVVAANVKELEVSESDDASSTSWPRRYFQVVVAMAEDSLRVVGLPAQVSAPVVGDPVQLVYTQIVASSDSVAGTVSAFLGAYLAGSGDLARYVAPGTSLTPITPAPYVLVDVQEVRADVAPAASPVDGDTLKVLATVSLLSPLDQQITSTYTLTLTARASRWEISAIDLAPQAIPKKGSPTPTPTPSGDGN